MYVTLLLIVISFPIRVLANGFDLTVSTHPLKKEQCNLLEEQDVKCVYGHGATEVLLNVETGRADVAQVAAEVLLIALKHIKNIDVIGELKYDSADAQDKIIVVVNKKIRGLKDFGGKKYCHPGNNFDLHQISNYVLNEFENAVIRENGLIEQLCAPKKGGTYLENYIETLAKYFGDSCRPFHVYNWNIDEKVRKTHESLQNCPEEETGFVAALKCLVDAGDVAVTTEIDFKEFFANDEYLNKKEDYRFLCRNGTINELDEPCYWNKQSSDLLVTFRDRTKAVIDYLEANMNDNLVSEKLASFRSALSKNDLLSLVLIDDQYGKINLIDPDLRDPSEYFTHCGRHVAKEEEINWCKRKINWYVTESEKAKCEWLSAASLNQALVPVIECVEVDNHLDGLKNVSIDTNGVIVVDGYSHYIKTESNRLEEFMFTASETHTYPTYVMLLRNKTSMSSYDDYEGKKACFQEYKSNGIAAFLSKTTHGSDTDHKALLLKLGDSCIPGFINKKNAGAEDQEKLCNLCKPTVHSSTAKNCKDNYGNKYYKNGTLACLEESDFVVVNQNDFPIEMMTKYYVMCKGEKIVKVNRRGIEEDCTLATYPHNVVVINSDNKFKDDIRLLFDTIANHFFDNSVFEVFDMFNDTKDILFSDSVTGFASNDDPHVRNYMDIRLQAADSENQTIIASSKWWLWTLVIIPVVAIVFGLGLFVCKRHKRQKNNKDRRDSNKGSYSEVPSDNHTNVQNNDTIYDR